MGILDCIRPLWPMARVAGAALLTVCLLAAGCSVKPDPYTEGQMMALALADQQAMREGIPPLAPDGRLNLAEAVLRAVVFNLDHRLALSENLVAERERVLAGLSMLPDLSVNGNAYDRSNYNASSSTSYQTRQQSLEPSFSSPRDRQWGGLEFSWSILDCGLSYYQAKQQADRVLITLERRRRVINTIVKDTVATYYRARAAQKYLNRIPGLIAEAEGALNLYRQIEKEKAEPLPQVLDSQRRLINTIAQLKRLESDLKQARVQLAALCNFSLRDKYDLTTPPMDLPAMGQRIDELELMGLHRRPELREEHYQERVDLAGVKQEMLKMFPAVRLLATLNADANPYLVNSAWAEAGLQVSASLLKLAVTGPAGVEAAEARQELSQMRRLALSMATLVQINLSRHQYQVSLEEMKTAFSLRDLERRLLAQLGQETALEAEGRLALVQQRAQTLSSELAYDLARVDAYSSLGNLYFALGVGPADDLPINASIDQIGAAVQASLAMMALGELPSLPAPEPVTDVQPPKVLKDEEGSPAEIAEAVKRSTRDARGR